MVFWTDDRGLGDLGLRQEGLETVAASGDAYCDFGVLSIRHKQHDQT